MARILSIFLFATLLLNAQAVRQIAGRDAWILDTGSSTYALGVNEQKQLQTLHWGGRVTRDADIPAARQSRAFAFQNGPGLTPEEYPAFGGMRFDEPALKATFADGVRDVVFNYSAARIKGNTLEIDLKDISRDLLVTLTYEVTPNSGILRKQATVQNREKQPVTLESFSAGVWMMPHDEDYRLSYLAGRWASETQLQQEPVRPGKRVLDSRRGNTSHQLNPWFALDRGGKATETEGDVWFGALGWSGNWKLTIEQTSMNITRVTGGYNDFDFSYTLKPGERLSSPSFYGGYSSHGFGEASRLMHRFILSSILPDHANPKPRPVLYNSWEATTFNVTEEGQKTLASKAAKLGVEMFVVDDGWFGARNNDKAGLGDWFVNKTKFPNGLKPLIDHVHGLNMKFGIWVEPEMVNPDSDLYRTQPDWAIHFPGRPRTESRNQLVLNMARKDVHDYILNLLDKLLTENQIDFIKWDMNRHFTEPGWPSQPIVDQKRIYVDYTNNVYDIFSQLRARHPNLEIESCSGGGGRIDLEILKRVDQVWTSDNTEAYDRIKIQEGFTFAYAPKAMMDWVTDVPNMNGRSTSLEYRFLVAMQGSLGIGGDLNHWSEKDMTLATNMVSEYKKVRDTVQTGALHRLLSPREGNFVANQYIATNGAQSVVFAYRDRQQFIRPVPALRLRGLTPDATYAVKSINNKLPEQTLSGRYLMTHGLDLNLGGDYDSTMLTLTRQ